MATIRRKGKPTVKTVGAVGDIYVDIENGRQYKCTFAYRNGANEYVYDWLFVGLEERNPGVGKRAEIAVDEAADIVADVVEEVVKEEKPQTATGSKYKNYNKQYNKK